MLVITGQREFLAAVDAWLRTVEEGLTRAVVSMAISAQEYATSSSPVYSGDFASNWNLSWGSPDTEFNSSRAGMMEFSKVPGRELDLEPLGSARGVPKGNVNLKAFRLGETIYLSNSAEHDEPYAWKIENNEIVFRSVNQGKDRVAEKTARVTHIRHEHITQAMMK